MFIKIIFRIWKTCFIFCHRICVMPPYLSCFFFWTGQPLNPAFLWVLAGNCVYISFKSVSLLFHWLVFQTTFMKTRADLACDSELRVMTTLPNISTSGTRQRKRGQQMLQNTLFINVNRVRDALVRHRLCPASEITWQKTWIRNLKSRSGTGEEPREWNIFILRQSLLLRAGHNKRSTVGLVDLIHTLWINFRLPINKTLVRD